MDYELNTDQASVVSTLRDVLADHAGPERARAALSSDGIDLLLHGQLEKFGLFDPDLVAEYGAHLGVILVEEVAASAGTLPIGTDLFVRHALGSEHPGGLVAVLTKDNEPAVPFAMQAQHFLRLDDTTVRILESGVEVGREHRTFPVPLTPVISSQATGPSLGVDPASVLAWWRVGLAAEMVGAASAALKITIEHLTVRTQFGRVLATRQAIQHRLAETHVRIEGARWLTRYAAYHGAKPELAATAASTAATMARAVVWETQQLQGAIGFTREYDLHLFTLRLHVLRMLLDGSSGAHAIEAARRRWVKGTPVPAPTSISFAH